jgi:hypothetical protein
VTGLSELGCLLLQLCLPDILLLRIPAGEYWDALSYEWDGTPSPCQDAHRQRTVNWINAAGGLATAFDITLKGVLHAGGRRLRDMKGGWIDVVQCLVGACALVLLQSGDFQQAPVTLSYQQLT